MVSGKESTFLGWESTFLGKQSLSYTEIGLLIK